MWPGEREFDIIRLGVGYLPLFGMDLKGIFEQVSPTLTMRPDLGNNPWVKKTNLQIKNFVLNGI